MALIQKTLSVIALALAFLGVFLVTSNMVPAQVVPSIAEAQAVQVQACQSQNGISANFNENAISSGNYIWFNSVMKLSSPVPDGGLTIYFTGQTIQSNHFTLTLPDSEVIFSSSATFGVTAFDTTNNMWVTVVPASFGDNVFLSGFAYQVPAGGLPGGIQGVTWSGTFSSSASFSGQWQWGAAVYTTFPSNWPRGYNYLGVKPLHSNSLDFYHNGDQAGTPENYKNYLTGGATGGGGSNWTGSYSGTSSFSCQFEAVPEMPGATLFLSIGVIAAFVSFRYRKFLN